MEAHSTPRRWTYAEFARLPSDTGTRYEVIAGELFVTPAPGRPHQRVVTDLVTLLNTFVRENDLGELLAGPFDVLFAEGDYLEPDIVFVGKDKIHLLTDRGVEGAPDLIVEVISPSTAARDRGIKLERYRHFGVAGYWVVDHERGVVEVWRLMEGAEEPVVLDRSSVLRWSPGDGEAVLEINLAEVLGEAP